MYLLYNGLYKMWRVGPACILHLVVTVALQFLQRARRMIAATTGDWDALHFLALDDTGHQLPTCGRGFPMPLRDHLLVNKQTQAMKGPSVRSLGLGDVCC